MKTSLRRFTQLGESGWIDEAVTTRISVRISVSLRRKVYDRILVYTYLHIRIRSTTNAPCINTATAMHTGTVDLSGSTTETCNEFAAKMLAMINDA